MDASGALLHPVTALDPHQLTDSDTAENEPAAAADAAAADTNGDAAQAAARVVPVRPISPAAAAQLAAGVRADKSGPDLRPAQRQPAAGTRRQLIFDVHKWMGRSTPRRIGYRM